MKNIFKLRLKEAMKDMDLRQVDLVDLFNDYCQRNNIDCKLSKSMLSMYLSGNNDPNSQRIAILATVLNVSEAWLIGYDVPKGRPSLTVEPEQLDLGKLSELNLARLKAYYDALIDGQNGGNK